MDPIRLTTQPAVLNLDLPPGMLVDLPYSSLGRQLACRTLNIVHRQTAAGTYSYSSIPVRQLLEIGGRFPHVLELYLCSVILRDGSLGAAPQVPHFAFLDTLCIDPLRVQLASRDSFSRSLLAALMHMPRLRVLLVKALWGWPPIEPVRRKRRRNPTLPFSLEAFTCGGSLNAFASTRIILCSCRTLKELHVAFAEQGDDDEAALIAAVAQAAPGLRTLSICAHDENRQIQRFAAIFTSLARLHTLRLEMPETVTLPTALGLLACAPHRIPLLTLELAARWRHAADSSKAARTRTSGVSLSVLSLSAAIARGGADDVPIVGQVLGSVMGVLLLAERMDRTKEALQSLLNAARELAQSIGDILTDRTFGDQVSASLETLHRCEATAVQRIEQFGVRHGSKTSIGRLLCYAFSMPRELERLTWDMSTAVQGLLILAALDTNSRVHATYAAMLDDYRYCGQYRNLKDVEVEKLDIIHRDVSQNGDMVVKYHRARVDGRLLVVRYFEESGPPASGIATPADATLYDRIAAHDRILEEVSTVRKSHRNVASLYGQGTSSHRARFVVLKSGFSPAYVAYENMSEGPGARIFTSALKILDAACHLQHFGITWEPACIGNIMIDEHGELTIGLKDDLRMGSFADAGGAYVRQLNTISRLYRSGVRLRTIESSELKAALTNLRDKRLRRLLRTRLTISGESIGVPRLELAHLALTRRETVDYLQTALASPALRPKDSWAWQWARTLLLLTQPHDSLSEASGFSWFYQAGIREDAPDWLFLTMTTQTTQSVAYNTYTIGIPHSQRMGVREAFGIVMPDPLRDVGDPFASFPIVSHDAEGTPRHQPSKSKPRAAAADWFARALRSENEALRAEDHFNLCKLVSIRIGKMDKIA
ncbi:hypothetical protein AURDEDRAFT_176182 [Auricularia subglabra TFB-10046 SS5]|uniref:Uncharacterized protein n=1 Tax=Auricularia subglabra (strain TFB-10046 / SS5) TaxID=717982 RepID=J0CW78_AURST|nr:hypothetical protein AURDEDRAFT_176182 [Auricularia subglabra TFB-10046 SS5]